MHRHHNQFKSSDAISRKFENTWLAWYPRLVQVVHENGGKFTGHAFAHLLHVLGIKDVPTTNKNLKSNAMCKNIHQTMMIMLKTLLLSPLPQTQQCLASCWWQTCYNNIYDEINYLNSTKSKPRSPCVSHEILWNIPSLQNDKPSLKIEKLQWMMFFWKAISSTLIMISLLDNKSSSMLT